MLSFAYSRLLKVKAGPAVRARHATRSRATSPSRGRQPNDTTYVFKLRKGVRWHPKPPVNGRELTAEDVKYTYERFLAVKGNGNRATLEAIDKIEAVDRYTVQVHAEGAVRLVPRRARLDLHVDRRQGVRREVRRPQEARGRASAPARGCSSATSPNGKLSSSATRNYFMAGTPVRRRRRRDGRHRPVVAAGRLARRQVRLRARVPAGRAAAATSRSPSGGSPGLQTDGVHRGSPAATPG